MTWWNSCQNPGRRTLSYPSPPPFYKNKNMAKINIWSKEWRGGWLSQFTLMHKDWLGLTFHKHFDGYTWLLQTFMLCLIPSDTEKRPDSNNQGNTINFTDIWTNFYEKALILEEDHIVHTFSLFSKQPCYVLFTRILVYQGLIPNSSFSQVTKAWCHISWLSLQDKAC